MSPIQRRQYATHAQTGTFDLGLRAYMLRVYNFMTLGLLLTGAISFFILNTPSLQGFVFSPLVLVLMVAEVGLVFFLAARINRIQASTAQMLFWIYAALNGITISPLLFQYTGESIARVFFISAAVFATMSLYGYTTKKDLSGFRTFFIAGLVGILIAALVNMFLASSALQFIISVAGVLLFVGLTAYDTQRIKEIYYESDSVEIGQKKAVMGALALYLDFINLFIFLLQLLGTRRE